MGTHAAACMAGADDIEVFNFSFELVRPTGRSSNTLPMMYVLLVCSWTALSMLHPG